MSELKPCPFCGGEASKVWIPYIGGGGYGNVIECDDCWAKTGYYATEAEAIAAWNARAERTCKNTQSDLDFMCSECGKCVDRGRVIKIKYCPNCGAKVVGE